MLTVTAPRNKSELALIGKALLKEAPEVYSRLKAIYLDIEPQEKELSKVPVFYLLYCEINNVPIDALTKSHEDRKVFMAAMLQLYVPHLFQQPAANRVPRSGLCAVLAKMAGVHKANISRQMDQAIMWMRVDESFKARVLKTVDDLTRED